MKIRNKTENCLRTDYGKWAADEVKEIPDIAAEAMLESLPDVFEAVSDAPVMTEDNEVE